MISRDVTLRAPMPLALLVAVSIALALLLPFERATAGDRISLGKDVRVELIDEFAHARGEPGAMLTFQLLFANRGDDTEVELAVHGNAELSKRVFLAAGKQHREWFSLPVTRGETAYPYYRVALSHPESGESNSLSVAFKTSGSPRAPGVREGTVGVIGRIDFPLNIDKTWERARDLDVDTLPPYWHGLVGYDLLLVDADWLTPTRRNAMLPVLLDWVRSGGVWVVVSDHDIELTGWLQMGTASPGALGFAREAMGFDGINLGLGQIVLAEPAQVEDIGPGYLQTLGIPSVRGQQRWQRSDLPIETLVEALPEEVYVNRLGLFSLLLLFALIAGPLGWFLLVSRRGRPVLYMGVVGVLSIGFGVAIVVFDFLDRGLKPVVRSAGIELIDQRTNLQMSFYESFAFRTRAGRYDFALAPSQGLYLSHGRHQRTFGGDARISLHDGKRWIGQTMAVRRPVWSVINDIQHDGRNLRLLRLDDGSLKVENYLDRDLTALSVWLDGVHYSGGALSSGRGALLSRNRAADDPQTSLAVLGKKFGLMQGAARFLAHDVTGGQFGENYFVARIADDETRGLPFAEPIRSVDNQAGRFIVGVLP